MSNLRSLISDAERNGLPQAVIGPMQGRMDALAAEVGSEPLPPFDPSRGTDMRSRLEVRLRDYRAQQGIPDPTAPARENPWVKMGTPELEAAVAELRTMGETAFAEEAAAELATRKPVVAGAKEVQNAPDAGPETTEGQPAANAAPARDNPLFRKPSQRQPADKQPTKQWFDDDSIPQKEFEGLVDQELADLNEMRKQLVDGPDMTPEEEAQARKFIEDRENAIIAKEIERSGASREALDTINTNLKTAATQLKQINEAIIAEDTPGEQIPNLVRRRQFLQNYRNDRINELRALRGESVKVRAETPDRKAGPQPTLPQVKPKAPSVAPAEKDAAQPAAPPTEATSSAPEASKPAIVLPAIQKGDEPGISNVRQSNTYPEWIVVDTSDKPKKFGTIQIGGERRRIMGSGWTPGKGGEPGKGHYVLAAPEPKSPSSLDQRTSAQERRGSI